MNSEKSRNEDVVEKNIYIFPKHYAFKLIILSCVILLLGFTCHISIIPQMKKEIAFQINQNKNCPLYYDNISFSPFTLSFKINNIHVPNICWGKSRSVLKFREVSVGPGFPGIWPLGLKLNVTFRGQGTFVRTSFLWGMKKILYIKKKSYLSSYMLNAIVGHGNILTGNLFMSGSVELKKNNIDTARLLLQSKHFNLLSKTIQMGALPLTLPALKIAPIAIEGHLAQKNFKITSFRLGDEKKGALFLNFAGNLAFNRKLNRVENVDLQGKIKIAKELLDGPLSILDLLWDIGKKPQRNGIYQIKFSGPFPGALTKPEFIP